MWPTFDISVVLVPVIEKSNKRIDKEEEEEAEDEDLLHAYCEY